MNHFPALPKKLKKNASIGIFSPSGFIQDDSQLQLAVNYFQSKNHDVTVSRHARSKWKYFSATDTDRLSDFHELLKDDSIDVIMSSRGGYGWSRIIHKLDYAAIKKSDKIFVGFSDFTLFNSAVLQKNKQITFHGPMACPDFKADSISSFTETHFWKLLSSSSLSIPSIACNHPYHSQTITGPIWGGCLSLLVHLLGTQYFPKIENGILFIEDVNEQPYHIERMLFQLFHAGVFSKQFMIVFGQFNNCVPTSLSNAPYTMDDVMETLRNLIDIPILTDFPFGHVKEKLTIPYGGMAAFSIKKDSYSVKFSEYNS